MTLCTHCHKHFKEGNGKGSLKRHLAAVKAAKSKTNTSGNKKKEKRNRSTFSGKEKTRNKNGLKVLKKKKITSGKITPIVSSFIENSLKDLIINDLKNHTISNEADLQFSVVYHLKQLLDVYENIRISSQLPIRIKRKDSDIFVDVVISTVVHSFSEISPFIAIELKEHNEFSVNDMRNDVRKLEKLYQNKVIKYGFQIYICRSKYQEKILQDESYGCVKMSAITPIVINIYDHISGREREIFDKRWNQSKRFYQDIATEHMAAKEKKRRRKKRSRT